MCVCPDRILNVYRYQIDNIADQFTFIYRFQLEFIFIQRLIVANVMKIIFNVYRQTMQQTNLLLYTNIDLSGLLWTYITMHIEKIYISTKYLNPKFNCIFDQLIDLGFALFSADYKKSYFSVDPICFQSGTDRNSAVIDKNYLKI